MQSSWNGIAIRFISSLDHQNFGDPAQEEFAMAKRQSVVSKAQP
jgi:hypothetical protein